MRIELVIDDLVLHEHDPRRRHVVADAIAAALASSDGVSELRAAVASWGRRRPAAERWSRAQADPRAGLGEAVVRGVSAALARSAPSGRGAGGS
jgi:hypothetical protein